MIMSLGIVLSACGKNESSQASQEIKGNDPLSEFSIESFTGNFDLISTESGECAASMQIIKVCEGVQARNNHLASHSFCHINKGELVSGDKRSATTVTFEARAIKSTSLIFDGRSSPPGRVKQVVTNTLSFEKDGNLRFASDSKQSICLYQKR